jgi:acyl-CoA synthetase (AMP-forming)/AMP-acid ligase II
MRDEIGGVGIVSGYGLTECPMITMSAVRDPDDKLAITEGRPGPGMAVELHDIATGGPAAPGEAGEVWVRGPQLFSGYVDAEDTRAAFDERGFFRTGDLGRFDEDGYLIITGRLKDVIIRKGENISAKEVEDHVFTHPDIADVAVVGVPDDRVGERCCAVLVLKPERTAPDVRALGEFLRGRGLMTQKWPEQVDVVAALPRNAAGKVLKHEIVRALRAGE